MPARAHYPSVAAVLCLATGCFSNEDRPFVGDVSRSAFWEYHDQVTESLCPELLPLLDAHAKLVGGRLGLALDRDEPFEYYRFATPEGAAKACGVTAGACAAGNTLFSPHFFDPHEQAHLYVERAWGGQSVPLLSEGEAVALSCSQFGTLDPALTPFDALGAPSWRDLFATDTLPLSAYTAAGIWVTDLARRYGWQAVAEVHQRVTTGSAPEDFAREFARVIPASVDDSWGRALGTRGAPYCFEDWLCEAPRLSVGEGVASCNGQIRRTISSPNHDGFVLAMGGPAAGCVTENGVLNCYGGVALVDCDGGSSPWRVLSGNAPTVRWVLGAPGTYATLTDITALDLPDLFGAHPPSDVQLEANLPKGFVGSDCAEAGVVTLDPARETYVDFLADIPAGWLRLEGGGRRYEVFDKSMDWPGRDSDGAPLVCDGCGAEASCVALPWNWRTSVAIGDDAVLRLPPGLSNARAPDAAYFSFQALPADDTK